MTTTIQRSFAGGEISPALYARVDTVKYETGLKTCRNSMVMRHGGVQNRPGTAFVGEVKDSSKTVRLFKFEFSDAQTYILEFGDFYMRVIKAGAQILEGTKAITAITRANPCVITSAAHGYSNGEEAYLTGILGMTQLNNRNFKIANVTANTFSIQYMYGTNVDSTAFSAYTSAGTAARVYTITTPYAYADLPEIRFTQSADVVTFAHPSYPPQELKRTGDAAWTITALTFAPLIARPTNIALVVGGAGAKTYRYRVTALATTTYEESLAGLQATTAITGITNASPAVVTDPAHGYSNGDEVFITGVVGMTQINGGTFIIAGVAANTFQLVGIDSTAYGVYTAGGTAARTFCISAASAAPTAAAPNVITWTAVSGAVSYNVYGALSGSDGFLGTATGTTFNDIGVTPDTTKSAPLAINPFPGVGDYPTAVTYHQQRLAFANTNNNPQTVWASKTGRFKNFTSSFPIQSDDSIKFRLDGQKVTPVRHLLTIGKLIMMTTSGEWSAEGAYVVGGGVGALTPTSTTTKPYTYYGSASVPPIIIGASAIYVQARGSIIRDLSYDIKSDGYDGSDLTIFSAHLFDGYTLKDWAYQQIPQSILWAVRSDGTLLGMTYVKDQQIVGWHRHDTSGTFEGVAGVSEGTEDSIYLVVKRTVNGRSVRYIERMQTRQVADIVDCVFTDATLSFDGRNTGSSTMTLTSAGTWTYTDTLTLTCSAGFFTAAMVGDQIFTTGADGLKIKSTITAFTSTTVVSVQPSRTVPASLQNIAVTNWARAVKSVGGLWHLEGRTVSALGDGFVASSPNNASYVTVTVTGGIATFDTAYSVIRVGLPYISDIETLNIDSMQGETTAGKSKLISKLNVFLQNSRGIWAGNEPPTNDAVDPLSNLRELKIRSTESPDLPVALFTGTEKINLKPEWNSNGRIFIRQVDPVPMAILAVAPDGFIPVGGK